MITDDKTDFLYLSNLLAKKKTFFKSFTQLLQDQKVDYGLLPSTKDIWCVDYMPIQVEHNKFIRFKYQPDYLQNTTYISTQTDNKQVCEAIGISTHESQIKIDGGNVIKGNNWVILTDKIFKENPNYTKPELIDELEHLFECKVIIIPQEPGDYTGHADGIVRYYDNDTVLINNYKPNNQPDFQRKLINELTNNHLGVIKIPFTPYKNLNRESADGLYINYLQMNNLIVLPTFNIQEDDVAIRLFEQLFPNQTLKTIDARDVSKEGGVLNCITWNIKKVDTLIQISNAPFYNPGQS
ncbi:MAG: agmatine deiminase family protein [Cyclobacteriaceae bacterium]|nr:MAG: agmatine deiminase family protein [Cyclobacteriaceae bacterium]